MLPLDPQGRPGSYDENHRREVCQRMQSQECTNNFVSVTRVVASGAHSEPRTTFSDSQRCLPLIWNIITAIWRLRAMRLLVQVSGHFVATTSGEWSLPLICTRIAVRWTNHAKVLQCTTMWLEPGGVQQPQFGQTCYLLHRLTNSTTLRQPNKEGSNRWLSVPRCRLKRPQ